MTQICDVCQEKIKSHHGIIQINDKWLKVCQNCHRDHLDPETQVSRTSQKGPLRVSHSAKVAIQSAKIVNGFGTYIQIFGIAQGIILIFGGFLLSHQLGPVLYEIGGVIFGLLLIAISAIQGAVFRMISSYVIARLENA
jgi:hypothetical protein